MEDDTGITDAGGDAPANYLLSPPPQQPSSWRLNIDHFRLPQTSNSNSNDRFSGFHRLFRRNPSLVRFSTADLKPITPVEARALPILLSVYGQMGLGIAYKISSWFIRSGKHRKVRDYYKKQERLLEGFCEMEMINDSGCLPESLTEDEMKNLAKSERMAITVSNVANMVLFIAKVYASIQSKSLAVIASTLDSLLDLLSGFILWFTSHAMRNPNQFHYPIGKNRMQPVGIIVFASVMGTLGFQILLESARQLIAQTHPDMNRDNEKWVIGIMVSVTVVKFLLMVYCRRFQNEIVRAYAQDHFFDVITNSVGLVSTVLAVRYKWWIDPVGAIIIALYTISTWARTVMENVRALIGRTAPPDFLAKLTYLVWNHHEEIKHIDTVRAYTFGSHYFVEVDIVLPEDMLLNQAHNIGEMLQEKLEQLPQVERAFVHIDFEFSHRPEHKAKV